jgi:hypothetical protein
MRADAMDAVRRGNVILSGRPADNPAVEALYHRCHQISWSVERGPHGSACLYNKNNGQRLHPKFSVDHSLQRDFGLVARIANPYALNSQVICSLGATGFASRMGLEFLSDPGSHPAIAEILGNESDTEVAFEVDVLSGTMNIIDVRQRASGRPLAAAMIPSAAA